MRATNPPHTACRLLASCLFWVLALGACKQDEAADQPDRPVVVASTTMLADVASRLGGEEVRVVGLVAPGADPHLYQPTPADARAVARSSLVIRSGLGLEGWIDDLLENAGGSRPIITASRGVEPLGGLGASSGVDPHFWFDLGAWAVASENISLGLVELLGADTPAAQRVVERTRRYLRRLDQLDSWTQSQLATIPAEHRVLITSHDAFGYFERAYDIDVHSIQGLSTEQEASQQDLARIIGIVRERSAPAVFVETSVNPALLEQVARETGVEVAGPLYSDSLGGPSEPAASFMGAFEENMRMITEGLGGKFEPFRPSGGPR